MDAESAHDMVVDAHCDLIIFSFGLAEALGYDLGEELHGTWEGVKRRDWVNNPETGEENANT